MRKVTHNTQEAKGCLKIVLIGLAIGTFGFVLMGVLLSAFVGFVTGDIIIAIITLLMIGYVVYLFVRRGFEMRRLATEGVETNGKIERKLTFGPHRYQIKYLYQDRFGRMYHHTSFVSRELYDSLEVGDPVKVVYLPNQPSVSGLLSDVEDARRALERKT